MIKEKITLLSDSSILNKVEEFCQNFGAKIKISENILDTLLIAITELVNNAVIHGNKKNPDKKVIIELISNFNTLKVLIKDEGEGFDEKNISDPTSEENLYKTSGRGVFIVKHMSKSFTHYKEEGFHVVELVMDLSNDNS